MIYAITSDDLPDFPIKIGVTKNNPEKRMADLQVGNPYRLKLLYVCDGNRETELFLHRIFSDERGIGEWFRRTERLLETLDKMWRLSPPKHPNGDPSRQKPTHSKKWANREKREKRRRTNYLAKVVGDYQKTVASARSSF